MITPDTEWTVAVDGGPPQVYKGISSGDVVNQALRDEFKHPTVRIEAVQEGVTFFVRRGVHLDGDD